MPSKIVHSSQNQLFLQWHLIWYLIFDHFPPRRALISVQLMFDISGISLWERSHSSSPLTAWNHFSPIDKTFHGDPNPADTSPKSSPSDQICCYTSSRWATCCSSIFILFHGENISGWTVQVPKILTISLKKKTKTKNSSFRCWLNQLISEYLSSQQ